MSTLSTRVDPSIWKDRMIYVSGLNDNPMSSVQFTTVCKNWLRSHNQRLSPEEHERMVNEAWEKLKKTLPKDHYTQTIFRLINVAGVVFLLIIGARACL